MNSKRGELIKNTVLPTKTADRISLSQASLILSEPYYSVRRMADRGELTTIRTSRGAVQIKSEI